MSKYTTILCKICSCEIRIGIYETKRHSGNCRKCANKIAASKRTEEDRDSVYLKKQLRNIKSRCSGKYSQYESYTRKGISVCDEWNNKPDSFVHWAKNNGWKIGLTIDRIDNDGNYEPNNCRWIDNSLNVLISEKSRKSRGASKYIGVWYRKDTSKWCAEVKNNKKKISLGCFHNEDEAKDARNKYIEENGLIHLKKN